MVGINGTFGEDIPSPQTTLHAKEKSQEQVKKPSKDQFDSFHASIDIEKRRTGLTFNPDRKDASWGLPRLRELVSASAARTWDEKNVLKRLEPDPRYFSPVNLRVLRDYAKEQYVSGAVKMAEYVIHVFNTAAMKTQERVELSKKMESPEVQSLQSELIVNAFTEEFVLLYFQALHYADARTAIGYAHNAYRFDRNVLRDALDIRGVDSDDQDGAKPVIKALTSARPSSGFLSRNGLLEEIAKSRRPAKVQAEKEPKEPRPSKKKAAKAGAKSKKPEQASGTGSSQDSKSDEETRPREAVSGDIQNSEDDAPRRPREAVPGDIQNDESDAPTPPREAVEGDIINREEDLESGPRKAVEGDIIEDPEDLKRVL